MKRMNSTVSAGTCKQHTGTRTIGCTVRQKKKKETMAHDVHDAARPCRCVNPLQPCFFSSSSAHHALLGRSKLAHYPIQLLARVLCCVACVCCMAWLLLCSDDEHWLLGMTKRWPPPPAAGLLSPFGAELLVRRLLL